MYLSLLQFFKFRFAGLFVLWYSVILMHYKRSLWSDILYYCSQNDLNPSFFLKLVHASSSLQIRSLQNFLLREMPSFTTATILMISMWNASQKSPSGIFQIWVNVPLPFGWLQAPPFSLFSIIQNDTSTRRSSWKGVYCNML